MPNFRAWVFGRFGLKSIGQVAVALDDHRFDTTTLSVEVSPVVSAVIDLVLLSPEGALSVGSFVPCSSEVVPSPDCITKRSEPSAFIEQELFGLHSFQHLTPPETIGIHFALLETTAIEDLLQPIPKTGVLGKAYTTSEKRRDAGQHMLPMLDQRCKHGMLKSMCGICKDAQISAPDNRGRTLDVFEFLKPYLYPPILPVMPGEVLFSDGLEPYPYQWDGIRFLTQHDRALLADEMGLGKTIQAIVALRALYHQARLRHVLVICPKSLLGTWNRELSVWAPELAVQIISGPADTRASQWRSNAHVFICTYDSLRQDVSYKHAKIHKMEGVVLDEIQKIKNPETKTHRAVQQVNATIRWGLSGTPLENKVEDLTAVFSALHLHELDHVCTWNSLAVQRAIAPVLLRRRIADVIRELPAKKPFDVWLELTPEQRKAYAELEAGGAFGLRKPNASRMHVLGLITILKKVCNYDERSRSSCKLDYLVDTLDDIVENGNKALVFSHLPNVTLHQIEYALQQFHPAFFDGSLSASQRDAMINDFQKKDYPQILLMSVQAGGLGITLTRANHVFHYDHWWNPAVAKQAEGRAHRIGQKKDVFVHHLYTIDTIEERIYQLLKRKQNLFDSVIDALSTDDVVGKLTDEELFGLFGLKPPVQPAVAARR